MLVLQDSFEAGNHGLHHRLGHLRLEAETFAQVVVQRLVQRGLLQVTRLIDLIRDKAARTAISTHGFVQQTLLLGGNCNLNLRSRGDLHISSFLSASLT